MENRDRKRMYELGEWLEEFLDRNLALWQLKDLCNNGMKLYGFNKINTASLPKHITDLNIMFDEETKARLLENMMFKSFSEFTDDFGITLKDFGNLFRPLYKINKGENYHSESDYQKIEEYRHINQWSSVNALICYHDGLFKILKELSVSNIPWPQAFAELRKTRTNFHNIFDNLSNHYSLLIDYFIFDNSDQFSKSKCLKSKSVGEEITTIIARTFLDFLEKGGQKHFKFCENCGRFTIVKRKNKQHCSDRCRTEFNRVNNK